MTESMLKRMVGVVAVKNGWAVQSIGYSRYRPIGRVETVVENLDRWHLDEVLVISIDRTRHGLGPDFDLLDRLSKRPLATPLCMAGGIGSVEDAIRLVRGGADRVCMDVLFRQNPSACRDISSAIGRQAVIRAQPVHFVSHDVHLQAFDYRDATNSPIDENYFDATMPYFSELLLVDWQSEGRRGRFRESLLDGLSEDLQVICFGGISEPEQVQRLVQRTNVSAVAIGNFLNYQEMANRRILPPGLRGVMRNAL